MKKSIISILPYNYLKLRPPIAEWQDGFSFRADGTGGGRNGLREDVDGFPFASTGLYDGIFQAVIVHSPYCPFWPSCLFRYPPSFRFLFIHSPRSDISHCISNLLSHRHSCDRGYHFSAKLPLSCQTASRVL